MVGVEGFAYFTFFIVKNVAQPHLACLTLAFLLADPRLTSATGSLRISSF
jgi:hypothetical protein